MALETLVLDSLDQKANDAFPGLVVHKDLLRRLRSAFSVPTFVIEFLLGKYCASPDPTVIEQGLEFVRGSLAEKYVKPDEREVVKARIQQRGEYVIIDKVSAALKEVDDKYWATLHNINQDYVHIDEATIREHDRLLMGGIWAEVTLRYDAGLKFGGVTRPFVIDRLRPIQLSRRDLGPYLEARAAFSRGGPRRVQSRRPAPRSVATSGAICSSARSAWSRTTPPSRIAASCSTWPASSRWSSATTT